MRLLGQAQDTYRLALTVYTREQFPERWAATQNNLARTYQLLRSWPESAGTFVSVLQVYPDYWEAYVGASSIYHDILFMFQEAFELDRQWVARHPDDASGQVNFVEKHFTTGRFYEFERQVNVVLAKPEIPASAKIALQVIGIANLLALRQPSQARTRLDSIIEQIGQQPPEFKLEWNFAGTKHFIGQHERLAGYRAWLGALFDAITVNETRDKILKALREVRANFKE